MANLPVDGETGWGDILNAYITALQGQANTTQTNLASHSANTPADPHGDRAYAQGLVNPITNNVNQPDGFVQLNAQGLIPANLISGGGGGSPTVTGGMYSSVFDAVATFDAVPGNGADQSTAIQNALNAVNNSPAGGIVYIGPGVFSLSNYLVIQNNTWLIMSEGTVLNRIAGSPNPQYIISNVQFGTSNTPSSDIRISGGKLDGVGTGGLGTSCTPIFLIQSNKNLIEDVYINNVVGSPAIEINGCTNTVIDSCFFDGPGANSPGSISRVPAIRVNVSSSSTTPSGLAAGTYNNSVTHDCKAISCVNVPTSAEFGNYGSLIGSDKTSANHSSLIMAIGCSTNYYPESGPGQSFYANSQWTYSLGGSALNLWYEDYA